ncbi:hypothetical protein [Myroides sp. LJL119]
MRKNFFAAILSLGAVFTAFAQSSDKNAIGLRFGGNSGLGTEISYQRKLQANNRLELGLGWKNKRDTDAFKLTGIYQWMWNLDHGFKWYAGPGAAIGTWNYSESVKGHRYSDNGTFVLLTGSVGLEYTFDIPLQIAVDVRPELYLNDSYRDGLHLDLGLALRYKF